MAIKTIRLTESELTNLIRRIVEDKENGFECVGCEEGNSGQKIAYHGSNNQIARLAVVCDVNIEELEWDIDAYELEYEEGTSIKAACNVCQEGVRCCAVVLKRA